MEPEMNGQIPLPHILVVGRSGSGKSSSIRTISPKTTHVLNFERKKLPFRGEEEFLQSYPRTVQEFGQEWVKVTTDRFCDIIIVESWTALCEKLQAECEATYTGFDVWKVYADRLFKFLHQVKESKKLVVVLALEEVVQDELGCMLRQCKVEGKKMKGSIEKEFSIVLWSMTRRVEDRIEYVFQTNTDGQTTAKSPMGMFPEQYIPNDLSPVIDRVREYYGWQD